MRSLYVVCALLTLWVLAAATSTQAQSASNWAVFVGTTGPKSVLGSGIGINPKAKDGYDADPAEGDLSLHPKPTDVGIELLYYRVQGPDWAGATGFYGEELEYTPLPPGASKTWSEFYLWAQNYTPTSANLGRVAPQFGTQYVPPAGYRGHLVLDYVPDSCNWTGDWDFWLDLTANNEFALPIPVVTDPLLGTRFHIDVYAIPEPSSLAALACGLAGVGGFAFRRRRHGSGA